MVPVKVLKISEPDYFLVGISSHQSDYKVSWAINNALKINLTAEEEYFSVQSSDNLLKEFSKFTFEEEESLFYYCLVSNLCENGYLIPKLKNIDFLLKISGDYSQSSKNKMIKILNKIDIINLTFEIENLPKNALKIISDL